MLEKNPTARFKPAALIKMLGSKPALIILFGCIAILSYQGLRPQQTLIHSAPSEASDNVQWHTRPKYRDIFFSHHGNIIHKWINFFPVYDDFFGPFIGKRPTVLEIGVHDGGSLQVLRKFLRNAILYGLDIDPNVCKLGPLGPSITTYCFDINDQRKFDATFGNMQFDIIVDDASHTSVDVTNTFHRLFKQLKPNGVYMVEDTQTSYETQFNDGITDNKTSIEQFKLFADLLHYYQLKRLTLDSVMGTRIKDLHSKKLTDNERYVIEWLHGVSFYDTSVVLKKRPSPKLVLQRDLAVGDITQLRPFEYYADIYYNISLNPGGPHPMN